MEGDREKCKEGREREGKGEIRKRDLKATDTLKATGGVKWTPSREVGR